MEHLRNRSGFWMEATIAFDEPNENGVLKEKKEKYVVEAATFIDGETRITKEMEYANRHIKVTAMSRPKYGTVCFNDADSESFFKVKVCIPEITETRSGMKTKVKSHYHLVQAASVEEARKAIVDAVYQFTTEDYEIADIVKTKICDVLEFGKHLEKEE